MRASVNSWGSRTSITVAPVGQKRFQLIDVYLGNGVVVHGARGEVTGRGP